jgi:hypothetical protein
MERETIERLAIDLAAGELNEDAKLLFEAYLSEHPQARDWSEDMLDIYEKTQTAINTKMIDERVISNKSSLKKNSLLQINWQNFVRWAAVIVFTALIGFAAGRWERPGQTNRIASHRPDGNIKQVRTVSDLREKYAGTFWGDKMLAMLESRPVRRNKPDFEDGSFWDKYKQYKGEQL